MASALDQLRVDIACASTYAVRNTFPALIDGAARVSSIECFRPTMLRRDPSTIGPSATSSKKIFSDNVTREIFHSDQASPFTRIVKVVGIDPSILKSEATCKIRCSAQEKFYYSSCKMID